MTCASNRRMASWPCPPSFAGALLGVGTLAAAVLLLAGCGGAATSTPSASTQQMQIMTTVERGDLVENEIAVLQLTAIAGGGATGTGRVRSGSTVTVAQGQQVRVYFVSRPANSGASPGGYPSPGSGGYPSTGADNGYAPPGAGGYASPGTGGPAPGSGAQLFDNNSLFTTAKNAPGVIESITKNSDGSATLTVRVTKLPAGVSSASFAIARLSTQVLARNVLLLPLAAISGSGSNTTVQVLVGGKTERRKVVVGKKTQTQVEIVSGLNEGDNVIYTRTFRNSWGSNRPWPGRSGYPQGALRSGYPVPGGSSGQ